MIGRPIQHYLDAADPSGRVTFSTRWHQNHITRDRFKTRKEYLRAHVLAHLVLIRGLALRLDKVKAVFADVEARIEPTAGDGPANISFNLARAFGLPGLNPAAELREFGEFLQSTRPFFEAHVGESPRLLITNNRTSAGRTYGKMEFLYNTADGELAGPVEFQAELDKRLDTPLMSGWLRDYAMALNRLGPWSSFLITADHVFDHDDHPEIVRLRKADEEARLARETPAGAA